MSSRCGIEISRHQRRNWSTGAFSGRYGLEASRPTMERLRSGDPPDLEHDPDALADQPRLAEGELLRRDSPRQQRRPAPEGDGRHGDDGVLLVVRDLVEPVERVVLVRDEPVECAGGEVLDLHLTPRRPAGWAGRSGRRPPRTRTWSRPPAAAG